MIRVALLEYMLFLNNSSLFYLAALIEKNKARDESFTSIVIPKAIIEGGESYVFLTFMIYFSYSQGNYIKEQQKTCLFRYYLLFFFQLPLQAVTVESGRLQTLAY